MMVALLFALLAGAFVVAYTSAFVCAGLSEDVTAVDILNSSGVDDDTPSPKQPAVDVM
ncbi:unnamed protein product [Cylicostephanus goldi]|uniref:Nematode cuticle collagen N-terminal domain-containing protein n=1 Tax=Cylicostephanus goldi TaxID=71465 RepID=A0A3P6RYV2_CYLGO|nr:unnamed protein product [Cylicostephanus goldi]